MPTPKPPLKLSDASALRPAVTPADLLSGLATDPVTGLLGNVKWTAQSVADFVKAQLAAATAAATRYEYTQAAPSQVWTIPHPLNAHPAVTTVDSAGTVLVGTVSYPDAHTVVIEHGAPFPGFAYLS